MRYIIFKGDEVIGNVTDLINAKAMAIAALPDNSDDRSLETWADLILKKRR